MDFDYSADPITLDLTNAATNLEVEQPGEKIKNTSGTRTIYIRLGSASHPLLPLKPGGFITAPFTRFYITHSAYAGETAELLVLSPHYIDVASADVVVETISEVTVNKLLERSEAEQYDTINSKNTFIGGTDRPAVAATYATVGLWNPGTNSKLLIVKKAIITCYTSIVLRCAHYGSIRSVSAGFQDNKYIEDSDGDGQIQSGAEASEIGTQMFATLLPANVPLVLRFGDNCAIPATAGLNFNSRTVNIGISALFEWKEVDA